MSKPKTRTLVVLGIAVAELAAAGAVAWNRRGLASMPTPPPPPEETRPDLAAAADDLRRLAGHVTDEQWDKGLRIVKEIRARAGEDRALAHLANRAEASILARADRFGDLDAMMDRAVAEHQRTPWRTAPLWADYVSFRLLTPDGAGICQERLSKLPAGAREDLERTYWQRFGEALCAMIRAQHPEPALSLIAALGGGDAAPFDRLLPPACVALGVLGGDAGKPQWTDEAIRRLEADGLDALPLSPTRRRHGVELAALYETRSKLFGDDNKARAKFWLDRYKLAAAKGAAEMVDRCAEYLVASAAGLGPAEVRPFKDRIARGIAEADPSETLRRDVSLLMRVSQQRGDREETEMASQALLALGAYEPDVTDATIGEIERRLKERGLSLRAINNAKTYILHGPAGVDGQDKTADDVASPWQYPFDTRHLLGDAALETIDAALAKTDAADWPRRGWLLAWLGRRAEAGREFETAYRKAAVSSEAVTEALKPAARALVLWSGTLAAADNYVKWRQFGADGADGEPGTSDDLTDPLARYAAPHDAK